ncbi:MAG: elongation factor Ts [Magnetococcales bacterium]|nr:elongation factor Ts [Magnetococcales bacterium]NGZ29343.1 elongation factor Ts [Magnetococcales bacterium]
MMAVTAEMVKNLREKTGAGMMDCKKALSETNGDMEAATDWLRKKGLSSAAKKSSRVAAEGKVMARAVGGKGVLVEVNSETDFSAKNEKFVGFVEQVSQLALDKLPDSMDAFKALDFPGTGRSVSGELEQLIATIGENLVLRRYASLQVGQGVVASYIHMGGKIGVLVGLESAASADALLELGKKVAMHVAASAPSYLDRSSVDTSALDRERSILADQARASGKPENIIEKMVEGRLNKFYSEVCLLEQPFVMDQEVSVEKAVKAAAKDLGSDVKVTGFARFVLGEGVEKVEKNFAEEVAQQLG